MLKLIPNKSAYAQFAINSTRNYSAYGMCGDIINTKFLIEQYKGPKFECQQEKGSNKTGDAFVRYVQGDDDDDDNTESVAEEDIVDIDYELFLTD